jgi:methylmalonyl-CoA/ethylmalonyl-CoA epimerase
VPSTASAALSLLGPQFNQVGIVVNDLELAVDAHDGWGPWAVYTIDGSVIPRLEVAGRPADFRIRVALNATLPQLELIQPLDDRSPYADWLASGGHGIHHLGFHVDSVAKVTEAMVSAGFELLFEGSGHGLDGDGAFAYYNTTARLGYLIEARTRQRRRRPPDAVSP